MANVSWRPEVEVGSKWSANALRFATEAEAKASATNLMMRWMLVTNCRAVESEDKVNSTWNLVTGDLKMLPTEQADG